MKITFLGTSSGWPFPRLGCRCPICLSSDPKDKRTRPSLLINGTVLIDAGPDVYNQLSGGDPKKLEAVVITHSHPDHYLGLYDLSHVYNLISGKITVFASSLAWSKIGKLIFTSKFCFVPIEDKKSYDVAGVKITPFIVPHTKRTPTFGLLISQKKSVVYIPDINEVSKEVKLILRTADIVIIDGSNLKKSPLPLHFSIEGGIKAFKRYKNEVIFTHIGHNTLVHQELVSYVEKNGGKNFTIAYDGMTLDL